jgi:hypothetical protein
MRKAPFHCLHRPGRRFLPSSILLGSWLLLTAAGCRDSSSSVPPPAAGEIRVTSIDPPAGGRGGGNVATIALEGLPIFPSTDVQVSFDGLTAGGLRVLDARTVSVVVPDLSTAGDDGRIPGTVRVPGATTAHFFYRAIPPRIVGLEHLRDAATRWDYRIITRSFAMGRHPQEVSLRRLDDGRKWALLDVRPAGNDAPETDVEMIEVSLVDLGLAPEDIAGRSFSLEVSSQVGADRIPIDLGMIEPPSNLAAMVEAPSLRIRLSWQPLPGAGDVGPTLFDYVRILRNFPTGTSDERILDGTGISSLIDDAVDPEGFHRYGIYRYELRGGIRREGRSLESSAVRAELACIPSGLPLDIVIDCDPGSPGEERTGGREIATTLAALGRNPIRIEGEAIEVLKGLFASALVKVVWVATGSTRPHLRTPGEDVCGILLDHRRREGSGIYIEGGDPFRPGAGEDPAWRDLLRASGLEDGAPRPHAGGLAVLRTKSGALFDFQPGIGLLDDLPGDPIAEGSSGDLQATFSSEPESSGATYPEDSYAAAIRSADGRAILASLEFKNLDGGEDRMGYIRWVLENLGMLEPDPPLIDEVSVHSACLCRGIEITARGKDLDRIDRIVLSGRPATIAGRDGGSIRFVTAPFDPETRPGKASLEFFDRSGARVSIPPSLGVFELEGIVARAIAPTRIPTDVAAAIRIEGSGFSKYGVTGVVFGDARIPDVQILDDGTISFPAPAAEASGCVPGEIRTLAVRVESSCNTAALDIPIVYVEHPAPEVSAIGPPSGCARESRTVVLSGSRLDLVEAVRREDGRGAPILEKGPGELRFEMVPRDGNRPGTEILAIEHRRSDDSLAALSVPFEHLGFTASSISQEGCCLGDAPFSILGTRFRSPEQADLRCLVAGLEVPFQIISDSELRASYAPERPATGILPVVLATGCMSVTLPEGLNVAAPSISGVEPTCVCHRDGGGVRFSGGCLQGVEAVSFGDVRIPRDRFLVSEPDRIEVHVPARADPGRVPVTIETAGGGLIRAGDFAWTGIAVTSPVHGSFYFGDRTVLKIEGAFVPCDLASLAVKVGSWRISWPHIRLEGGWLIASIPALDAPATLPVVLESDCGTVDAGEIEFFDVTASAISPPSACMGAPVSFAISGEHLDVVEEVFAGSGRAVIREHAPTRIVCDAALPSIPGMISILLLGKGGEVLREVPFIVEGPAAPELTPHRAPRSEPGTGSIRGSCLATLVSISFGGLPAAILSRDESQIEFRIPKAPDHGEVPVAATFPGGRILDIGPFIYTNDFCEGFSGSIPEWEDDGLGGWAVSGGSYVWTGKGSAGYRSLRCSLNRRSFGDFDLSVRMVKARGEGFEAGVVCRATENFWDGYLFVVGRIRGEVMPYAAICKMADGALSTLIFVRDAQVPTQDGAAIALEVQARGGTIRFGANGRLLGTISDGAFQEGMVGLIAREQDGPIETAPVIRFDDFCASEETDQG